MAPNGAQERPQEGSKRASKIMQKDAQEKPQGGSKSWHRKDPRGRQRARRSLKRPLQSRYSRTPRPSHPRGGPELRRRELSLYPRIRLLLLRILLCFFVVCSVRVRTRKGPWPLLRGYLSTTLPLQQGSGALGHATRKTISRSAVWENTQHGFGNTTIPASVVFFM